jgi:hypothetical protein
MKYILIIWLSTGSITVPLEQGNCDSFMQELEDQGRITYNVPDTFLDSVPLWGYHCTTLEQLDAEFTVEELNRAKPIIPAKKPRKKPQRKINLPDVIYCIPKKLRRKAYLIQTSIS